jgi:DNA polymerase III delta subunit
MSRVDAIARSLAAIFAGATLKFEQIEPYLGDLGAVPEWDLTDAIEVGDAAKAITVARRMLDSQARVGVQIIGILARRYLKMARLDGSGATTGEEAAAIVGGHEFPARKLVQVTRLLGSNKIAQSLELIGRADRDLKGGVTYGGDNDRNVNRTDLVVVEVLVARLAKLVEAAKRR